MILMAMKYQIVDPKKPTPRPARQWAGFLFHGTEPREPNYMYRGAGVYVKTPAGVPCHKGSILQVYYILARGPGVASGTGAWDWGTAIPRRSIIGRHNLLDHLKYSFKNKGQRIKVRFRAYKMIDKIQIFSRFYMYRNGLWKAQLGQPYTY